MYSEIAFIERSEMVIDEYRRKHSQQNPSCSCTSTYRFDDNEWAGFAAVCPEGTKLSQSALLMDNAT
jgi:hypothetical protein